MRKIKYILWYIFVIVCTVIANLALHYQKEPTDKKAVEKQYMGNNLKKCLHITDDSIDDVQVDENRLMIALMYFNYNNRHDMYLTKEEALQEYNNFCTGSGSYDKIMALSFCRWYDDADFTEDLQNELECLETSGGDFDWSILDKVDSEKLSEICYNILEQPDILQQANSVDYGGCDLDWKLLDLADEWRCSIDEDGNYYFKFDEGKGIAYCSWGKYAHPYEEEQLYVTKIVYDGGIDADEGIYDDWGYAAFAFRPAFGCHIGMQYDENMMKSYSVPEKWVILYTDEQKPCFRYGNIQVSIELDEMRVKRVILSIVEE